MCCYCICTSQGCVVFDIFLVLIDVICSVHEITCTSTVRSIKHDSFGGAFICHMFDLFLMICFFTSLCFLWFVFLFLMVCFLMLDVMKCLFTHSHLRLGLVRMTPVVLAILLFLKINKLFCHSSLLSLKREKG